MGLENFYGDDSVENRFVDPDTNEAYFVLVNKQTGEKELWNEDFGFADKKVGTISPDGTIDFNNKWFSNVNKDDKDFANQIVADGTLNRIASEVVQKNSDLNPAQTKQLLGGNGTNLMYQSQNDLETGLKALSATTTGKKGNTKAGTRIKFPDNLRYPEDISPQQDIMQFNMLKYVPKGFDKKAFGFAVDREKRNTIGTVCLPIPSGIEDSMAVTWGKSEMNAVQVAMYQAALEGITAKNPVEGVVSSLQNSAQKVLENQGEAKAGLAAYVAGRATGNQDMLARTTGAVMNPNMELLFGGPTLRPLKFSFTLSARYNKEAMMIMRIIRFFKQGMSPIRSKSMMFLKSPHTFQLKYKLRGKGGQDHPYLNRFKECALQGFGVQYTPTGNYSTFDDGVMSQYQMSMTFTELEPVFNDDYGNDGTLPAEIGF